MGNNATVTVTITITVGKNRPILDLCSHPPGHLEPLKSQIGETLLLSLSLNIIITFSVTSVTVRAKTGPS